MNTITVSSKGQLAIPKAIRDALNLAAGTKLAVRVRGNEIILAKESPWKRLRGAASGRGVMETFAAHRRTERKREDSRS